MGEGNGAFLALCLPLVGEVASENLAIFAANVLGIFQLLKKCRIYDARSRATKSASKRLFSQGPFPKWSVFTRSISKNVCFQNVWETVGIIAQRSNRHIVLLPNGLIQFGYTLGSGYMVFQTVSYKAYLPNLT